MYNSHLISHINHPQLQSDNTLHVIGVVSNPVRYHSRYRLARKWIEHISQTPNVKLHIVEAAFGERCHELEAVCKEFGAEFIPIRTHSEIWIKENMINLGVRRIPDAKYIAWVDADVFFRDSNWAQEALHQLQHFQIIQPWSECLDLGPHGNVMQLFRSFGMQHQKRIPKQKHSSDPYPYAHSGFAWACTRAFWEQTQGLLDFSILGSADHHMSFGCIGEIADSIHGGMTAGFKRKCMEWQAKAVRACESEVGFVPGRIEHEFHGPKKRRYYRERWQILVQYAFNPDTDLKYDPAGVLQLVGKPQLEQAVRQYNRSRMEDSIEEN